MLAFCNERWRGASGCTSSCNGRSHWLIVAHCDESSGVGHHIGVSKLEPPMAWCGLHLCNAPLWGILLKASQRCRSGRANAEVHHMPVGGPARGCIPSLTQNAHCQCGHTVCGLNAAALHQVQQCSCNGDHGPGLHQTGLSAPTASQDYARLAVEPMSWSTAGSKQCLLEAPTLAALA